MTFENLTEDVLELFAEAQISALSTFLTTLWNSFVICYPAISRPTPPRSRVAVTCPRSGFLAHPRSVRNWQGFSAYRSPSRITSRRLSLTKRSRATG